MLRTIAPVVSFSGSSNNNKNSKQPIHFVQKRFVQITKAMLWFCLPWKRRRCQRIKITTKLRMIRKIKLFFQRKTEIKSKWLNMRSFGAAERERERGERAGCSRTRSSFKENHRASQSMNNDAMNENYMQKHDTNMHCAGNNIYSNQQANRTHTPQWMAFLRSLSSCFRPFQPNAISFDFI